MKNFISKLRAKHSLSMVIIAVFCQYSFADRREDISQIPLMAGNKLPANIALVLSIEWPTLLYLANPGYFNKDKEYGGYFTSNVCYSYVYHGPDKVGNSLNETNYFNPVRGLANFSEPCGNDQWHGNFLNWAITSTTDAYRKALTGGYRVIDTENVTVLERSRILYVRGERFYSNRRETFIRRGYAPVPKDDIYILNMQQPNIVCDESKIPSGSGQTSSSCFYQYSFSNLPNKPSLNQIKGNRITHYDFSNTVRFSIANKDKFAGNLLYDYAHIDFPKENKDYYVGGLISSRQLDSSPNGVWFNPRVKVCDKNVPATLTDCMAYSDGATTTYKPVGVLQKNEDSVKVSVFSFLNTGSYSGDNFTRMRDGGVLRAAQKFLGSRKLDEEKLKQNKIEWVENPNREWDQLGRFIQNPDSITTTRVNGYNVNIEDSGVINYINKFYALNTNGFKSFDPLSELFYAAHRYYRNMSEVSSYSGPLPKNYQFSGIDNAEGPMFLKQHVSQQQYAERLTDNFPVITDWNRLPDPIIARCQPNAFIVVGDAVAHGDGNLPGSLIARGEPPRPAEVSNDPKNVSTLLREINRLEGGGIGHNVANGDATMYLASLAYDAHVNDLRPDLTTGTNDKVTADTYILAVEDSYLTYKTQLVMAAKYGGFDKTGFDPRTAGDGHFSLQNNNNVSYWSDKSSTVGSENYYPTPNNYYRSSDSKTIVSGLTKIFSSISAQTPAIKQVGAVASSLDVGGYLYDASYQISDNVWLGDVIAYNKQTDKGGAAISGQVAWRLSDKIIKPRAIYTYNTASSKEVKLSPSSGNLSKLPSDIQNILNKSDASESAVYDNKGEARIQYLLGDRTYEIGKTITEAWFKARGERKGLVGDIINSTPAYLSESVTYGYESKNVVGRSTYNKFLNSQKGKTPILAVGSNDGIFHILDANTGNELYAYMPSEVLKNVHKLTSPTSQAHQYFVDGSPIVHHVYHNGAWSSIIIGTMGAGGSTVFAIDVTDPKNISLLWEFSGPTGNDLGKLGLTIPQPQIIAASDGFRVAVSSGYGLGDDVNNGFVWFLNPKTGAITDYIEIDTKLTQNNQKVVYGELGTVTPIYRSGTFYGLYIPSTQGQVWRVSAVSQTVNGVVRSGRITGIKTTKIDNIFNAVDQQGNPQPITSAISVGGSVFSNLASNPMIYFGTGSYYRTTDVGDQNIQSFYAIVDNGKDRINKNDLMKQTFTQKKSGDTELRVVHDTLEESETGRTDKGWYVDLITLTGTNKQIVEGERVISSPMLLGAETRNGILVFNSYVPAQGLCGGSGSMYTNFLSKTGLPLSQSQLINLKEKYGIDSIGSIKTQGGSIIPSVWELTDNNVVISGIPEKIPLGQITGQVSWSRDL